MFYRGKTFAALLIAGAALLPAFLPAQAAGKPASPELLIYVKEPKQYWLKPAGKEVAMYLGQDKTAELGANLKRLKVDLKKVKRQTLNLAKPTGRDTDRDGLPDQWEAWFGTDPKKADTDGDRNKDKLELVQGYDPRGTGKLRAVRQAAAVPPKAADARPQALLAKFAKVQGNDQLKRFASLDEYKKFLNSHQSNSSSYLRGGMFMALDGAAAAAPTALADNFAGKSAEVSNVSTDDYSQTNVQVAGVDEADQAKTDGKNIYYIAGNSVQVISALPADPAKVVASISFESGNPTELYLENNRLTVIGQEYLTENLFSGAVARFWSYYRSKAVTYIKTYDISDPAAPKLAKDVKLDGSYAESRLIGGYLYLVINDYSRTADQPLPSYFINKKLVADSRLPYYFDTPYNSTNLVSLVAVPLAAGDEAVSSEHFMLPGTGAVYASADNFYVTYEKYVSEDDLLYEIGRVEAFSKFTSETQSKILAIEAVDPQIMPDYEKRAKILALAQAEAATWPEAELRELGTLIKERANAAYGDIAKELTKTVIHKIALKQGKVSYQSEGSVPGQVLNQFAMNERDGKFYIATTKQRTWSVLATDDQNSSYSNVYVLDGQLKPVSSLENLAPGERMYSARFIGDRLYLVTFKQVDPLFVIDLSGEAPKAVGELKLPGFSTYLHPYDDGTLIGLGRDADEQGRVRGLKIALFDVSDVAAPKTLASLSLGRAGSYSTALDNHKQFVYASGRKLLFLPVSLSEKEDYAGDFSGVSVLDLSNKQITERGRVQIDQGYYGGAKSLYIGDYLYTLTPAQVKINRISDLTSVSTVVLPGFSNANDGGTIMPLMVK